MYCVLVCYNYTILFIIFFYFLSLCTHIINSPSCRGHQVTISFADLCLQRQLCLPVQLINHLWSFDGSVKRKCMMSAGQTHRKQTGSLIKMMLVSVSFIFTWAWALVNVIEPAGLRVTVGQKGKLPSGQEDAWDYSGSEILEVFTSMRGTCCFPRWAWITYSGERVGLLIFPMMPWACFSLLIAVFHLGYLQTSSEWFDRIVCCCSINMSDRPFPAVWLCTVCWWQREWWRPQNIVMLLI